MKFTARIVAFILMAAFAVSAFAGDKFRDIQTQMMSKNWSQSEQMLKSYLDQKPNSAKANYLLAQVYEQTRKYDLAQTYLDKANSIDPSQRFASPGQAMNMANRLSVKTATTSKTYARTEKPAYHAPSYTPPAPRVTQPQVQAPAVAQRAPEQKSSGGGGVFIVALLVLAGLAAGGYFFFISRAKKQRLQELDDQRRALQAQGVKQQERVADLRKKLTYEGQSNSDLASDIESLAAEVNNTTSSLRAQVSSEDYPIARKIAEVERLERELTSCEGRLQRKAFNKPAPAPRTYTPNATTQAAMREADDMIAHRSAYQAPRPTYTPPPAPQPVQQPVQQSVVHEHHYHDNSPDLLTTMVVADALSHSRHDDYAERALREERERNARLERELEREREEDRRREREAERRREAEEEERRNTYQAPVMDFGGSSDDDEDERRRDSSPALDFGGSDNSSDSGSDFGGSDNDDD